jgi:hypothetical protein
MFRTALAAAALLAAPAFAQSTPSADGAELYFDRAGGRRHADQPRDPAFRPARHGCRARRGGARAPATTTFCSTALRSGRMIWAIGLPADDNHRHFGGGQTEVTLDLPAGTHTLQLVLGDMNHVPHDPPVTSEVITITVE